MKLSPALIVLSVSASSAFTINAPITNVAIFGRQTRRIPKHQLSAIIYGWDGEEEEDDNSSYIDILNDIGPGQCSGTGVAVAETLSRDESRVATLARLAVAFSPPERAIGMKDIERVEVVCVREDQIELAATLCESGGCVNLSVPIKLPRECSDGEWLQGCVLRNLEDLEVEAESTLLTIEKEAQMSEEDLEELCQLNQKVQYPNWWIPPECDANLVAECDNIKRLLNEKEFHTEIIALAQDGLEHAGEGDVYTVKRAKVAAVGPAGMCLKVGAIRPHQQEDLLVLDVMYPFGGDPIQDVDTLRAIVLGSIANAEDKR